MKKSLVGAAAGSLLLFTGVAFAADKAMTGDAMMHRDSMKPSSMMMMHPPAPMVLNITNGGTGLLRGVVASVATSSFTVAAWGGAWTVTTDIHTTMAPKGSMVSDIKVGDYVGVMGMVSENSPSITATVVRDWSAKKDAMMHGDSMMHDKMSSTSGAMLH